MGQEEASRNGRKFLEGLETLILVFVILSINFQISLVSDFPVACESELFISFLVHNAMSRRNEFCCLNPH